MNNAFDQASLFFSPRQLAAGKVFSTKPASGNGVFTFTRSGAIGTYINSAGKIVNQATANMPRFSYNGSCLELLVEGASTNTCKSADFNDMSVSNATKAQNASSPIDGRQSIALVEDASTGVGHFISSINDQFVTGQVNLVSFMYKPLGAGSDRHLVFNLGGNGSGSVRLNTVTNAWAESSNLDITGVIAPVAIPGSGGWYRAGVFVNASYTNATIAYRLYNPVTASSVYDGDSTSGLLLIGENITTDAELTSFIPKYDNNNTTSVARAQETLVLQSLGTNGLLASLEGSLQLHITMSSVNNDGLWKLRGANDNDMITCSGRHITFDKDGSQEGIVEDVLPASGVNTTNIVITFDNDDAPVYAGNTLIDTATFTASADLSEFRIEGKAGKTCAVRKIAMWPFKLTSTPALAISNLS